MLNEEVVDDQKELFRLSNGVLFRVTTGSYVHTRSASSVFVCVDEAAFFDSSAETCTSDELIRSIRPSLLNLSGTLLVISTKYRTKGFCYTTWKRYYGRDDANTLVIDAPSTLLNPTLSEDTIAQDIADDPACAAEYTNGWREDIEDYLPRSTIELCVIRGRRELLPMPHKAYFAFADCAGGRIDPAALCIGFREGRKTVVSFLRQWRAPFSPVQVTREMASHLKRYGLTRVVGDQYAASYNTDCWKQNGVTYVPSLKNKSACYQELIGPITAQEIELPDNETLITQLASLERRGRSTQGGDRIDHPRSGHDDLANTVAGLTTIAGKKPIRTGGWGRPREQRQNPRQQFARWYKSHHARVLTYG